MTRLRLNANDKLVLFIFKQWEPNKEKIFRIRYGHNITNRCVAKSFQRNLVGSFLNLL
jgi:hypothetical protein